MPGTSVRTLPRVTPGTSARVPGSQLPGHLRRMAALRREYRKLGLVKPDAAKPAPRRPVRMGGKRYPSAAAAERAIGASRGAVAVAAGRGQRCHGLKVEWADVPRTKGYVDDDNS